MLGILQNLSFATLGTILIFEDGRTDIWTDVRTNLTILMTKDTVTSVDLDQKVLGRKVILVLEEVILC